MSGTTLESVLARDLGREVERLQPISGGDINDAFRAWLIGGDSVFVKTRAEAPPGMFPREAEGLGWLAEARALRLPEVLACGDSGGSEPGFLALEWIEPAGRRRDFDALLGRGLAALHRSGAPGFGLARDNFIGPLPQPNAARDDWPSFYGELRLLPLARAARDSGRASADLVERIEALVARLPERVGPPEPPARLHGDLWAGNLMCDAEGAPCLIDPAVYGGHREVDLAMMRLFGGFSEACFAAYAEAWPLAPGLEERVPLYQLYPLLVHVNLFGAGYVGSLESALAAVT